MFKNLIILCFVVSAVLAYPYELYEQPAAVFLAPAEEVQFADAAIPMDYTAERVKRQLNIQGGGNPGKGVDISANARVPVWTSDNGRHSIDATGNYAQHLGGPYGNSRPSWGAGGVYTFRF